MVINNNIFHQFNACFMPGILKCSLIKSLQDCIWELRTRKKNWEAGSTVSRSLIVYKYEKIGCRHSCLNSKFLRGMYFLTLAYAILVKQARESLSPLSERCSVTDRLDDFLRGFGRNSAILFLLPIQTITSLPNQPLPAVSGEAGLLQSGLRLTGERNPCSF